MTHAYLGFKAFDLHELLCHFLARRAGLYARQGLDVTLIDTSFLADDQLPPDTVHAACGAALMAWLQGAAVEIVLVAVDRPLFWLHAAPGHDTLATLRGARIASYPPVAPPAHFLRIVLERAGLDPVRDVTIAPVRDDTARLGLLRAGDVEAALLSSAVPATAMRRAGFATPAFIGAALRVPTTGLAVRQDLRERRPELVQALVDAHAAALRLIHEDSAGLAEVLEHDLGLAAPDIASTRELARACFTRDGASAAGITAGAVAALAQITGITEPRAGERSPYDFSLLDRGARGP